VTPVQRSVDRSHGPAERGGPFSDRSGGLIIIDAADEGAAGQMVANDPFQRAALLEQ
jgi:uncharacterized protein YciI